MPSGEAELALALALAALPDAADEALPLPPHPTSTNASANAQHANATTGDFFMASTFHIKLVIHGRSHCYHGSRLRSIQAYNKPTKNIRQRGVRLRCLIFMEEGAPLVLQLIVLNYTK